MSRLNPKPKSEAQKERDRANEKRRRLIRMQDPAYAEKIRIKRREYKAKLRKCPEYRVEKAEWLRQDRIRNPERYKKYQEEHHKRKGESAGERRRRWRIENHDRYVARYKEDNPKRIGAVIASFRRGDASFDELSECLRQRYVRNIRRAKGER